MLFNSVEFGLFLPIAFLLYWFVFNKKRNNQNLFILVISYLFYGWWDWRFLFLIFFSTICDYLISKQLKEKQKKSTQKALLWTSIFFNIGLLLVFKYFNFFIDNFNSAFSFFGTKFNIDSLQLILPVGISFYTFQTLSYTIDVYHKKLAPSNNFIEFGAYVSFFPQLVAGPIERATQLLPQFQRNRKFNYSEATNGLMQILWGLFKKVIIADNCAEYANMMFNSPESYNGSTLVLGAFFFTFQIYGDFSGYSDIAIGTSRLFGFNLMKNFSFPYFSRDIPEFWRRWHISLTTWFRDYIYIPLGGSKGGKINQIRNVFIIFFISGFWHGANWTYIIWGLLNAVYFIPFFFFFSNRKHIEIAGINSRLPSLKEFIFISLTFSITMLTWVFFRAESLTDAFTYLEGIFNSSVLSVPHFFGRTKALKLLVFIILLIIIEWNGRHGEFALDKGKPFKGRFFNWIFYYLIILFILMFSGKSSDFIYFQF